MYWSQSYNLENVRILLVDKNEHMRSLLTGVLKTLGVRYVATANDGEQALHEMGGTVPDIILTGISMTPITGIDMAPMTGIDFVERIRSGEAGIDRSTPVIVISSYTEEAYVQKARDAGIDEFVAKPVSAKTLYERLAAVIDKRRPFIDAPKYFGPDRRRHREERPEDLRRKDDEKRGAILLDE